jgi:NAD(P)-dependent dehydrogenase (short-subunit alcohol dehydrogenase family)
MGRACVEALRPTADVLVAVDLEAPALTGTVGAGCDVADPGSVAQLVARVADLGRLRALVHAAGLSPTMADARRIFEVNLVGTRLVLDHFELLAGPETAAVCFSSSAAYLPAEIIEAAGLDLRDPLAAGFLDRAVVAAADSGYAYALSKAGVIQVAARAAVAWGRRGARVNSVAPGLIDTPMGQRELARQPFMRQMLTHSPPGRLGRPEELASVCRFLLSEDASFLSGVDVLVDGGLQQSMAADQS